jgi:hypothetical protein
MCTIMFPLEPPLYTKLALGSVWDGMQGLQTRSLLILGSGHARTPEHKTQDGRFFFWLHLEKFHSFLSLSVRAGCNFLRQ